MSTTRLEKALAAYKNHFLKPEPRAFAELRVSLILKDFNVYVQQVSIVSIFDNIKKLNKSDSRIECKHAVFLLGDLLQKGHADEIPPIVSFEDPKSTYRDNWAMFVKLAGAEAINTVVPDWGFFCDKDKKTTLSRLYLPDSLCPPRSAPIQVAEVMFPGHFGEFDVYCSVMRDTYGSDVDAIDRRILLLAFFRNGFDSKNDSISAAFLSWKYSEEGLNFFASMQFQLAKAVNETEKKLIDLALKARFPPSSPSWPSKICLGEGQSMSNMSHGELVLMTKKLA